ncbi:MAG: hypothetical protein N3A02_04250, partial [Rectinema sp.]|nr:hypothetical protein [Rectinema sp.]
VASVASRASTAASANRESEPEQDESSLSRESRLLQALGLFTILRHLPVVARGDPASALILRTPEKIFLLRWPDALTAYARHALLDQTIDDDEIENALYDILVQESVATAAGIIAGEQHVIRRLMVHGNIGRFLVVQPQVTRPAPNGIPLEVVPVTEWASA